MGKMMEYKGYHATVEYDSEDDIFFGEVFGINDSLNFHGTSINELKEMFHQCIDHYLEMCKEFGKAPEKEYSGSFNVRIPFELHRDSAIEAMNRGLTLNNYVKTALENELNRNDCNKETLILVPYASKDTTASLAAKVNMSITESDYSDNPFVFNKEEDIAWKQ